ncbi:replication fork protection component Swi3-domain-containing protein [Lasiosphaeris hirsuta]|uniref:Chromosome segregation in meiosis protein n=1 Tax=Lasiosphaeris hirsuta TaxID=260670 RepID=A0AA40E3S9_9PEZI|nr:replication fork protection component Swi3-domain-containing protein [Lasiosphaeris hirsuta]
MPPKASSAAAAPNNTSDILSDYLADWDDDPFRSPSPKPGSKKNDKKRKEPDTLGIDEQIDITKKARAPRVKLDDARLLSEKGIPKLRKMATRIRLKGKGHEADASRLLSFYQEWLDDLFPKATFLDALAMVEKAGHKTTMRTERVKWIDELKPRLAANDDDEYHDREPSAPSLPTRTAPIFEQAAGRGRAKTPAAIDDLFGDDDIYNATPRAKTAPAKSVDDVPDEDDLDALMAEAEVPATTQGPSFGSIFGGGLVKKPSQPSAEPDDDELDTLMAEAEAQPTKRPIAILDGDEDEDELDALMAEADTVAAPPKNATKPPASTASDDAGSAKAKKLKRAVAEAIEDNGFDDMDDLDALMAEAEAGVSSSKATPAVPPNTTQTDDEEAMAEMDGL